jgi:hypothetical protein
LIGPFGGIIQSLKDPDIYRLCTKCYKKQVTKYQDVGVYNFKLKKYITWEKAELSKDEVRDFKLKKLGI